MGLTPAGSDLEQLAFLGLGLMPMRTSGGLQLPKGRNQGFSLLVDGVAVLVFGAPDIAQAKALCSEAWFQDDLATYRSNGAPIWPAQGALTIRKATPEEFVELSVALGRELSDGSYEKFVFAFLVPIDLPPS